MRIKSFRFLRDGLLTIFLLIAVRSAQAQVSYNTYLLANLNQHTNTFGYSIGCWGYVQNGREYALLGCYSGTSFVDVTDSANIHEVAFLLGNASSWRDFKIYTHYAYIVNDVGGGMQIVDLQYLPDSIHYLGTWSFTGFSRAHTMQQSGPYLYLNGGNYASEGTFVLDLTQNPEVPVKRGQWENAYVHDCRVIHDTIWACNIYTGTISVIDATNKDSLWTITSWVNGSGPMPHNCAMTDDRKYLFTTDEILNPVGRLKVWNVQDLSNILYVTTWWPVGADSSNVHNVEIYGHYALICHYTAGIRILDITNPEQPVEVAYYDTYPANNGNTWNGCKGIYMLPSGKVLGNDKQTGLYVIKTTFPLIGVEKNQNNIPRNFSLRQNYPNPFNPSTTIEFSLPHNSRVIIKLFDILGKEVKTLFDGYTRAGTNKITYNASGLASGVYFYRMQTGEFSDVKKMVLVK